MSPDNTREGGSLFASIRGLGEPEKAPPAPAAPLPSFAPAPAATPPPAPAVDLQPLQERLERIEKGMAAARQHDPAQRIAELERQLKQTQEQAVGALVTLREREEAQKAAQRDMEAMLKNLSSQRRSEELDRQMRDRIAELENRILAMAKAEPPAPRPDPAVLLRLEALEAESLALQRRLRAAAEESEHKSGQSQLDVQALRAGLAKLGEESKSSSRQGQLGLESLRTAVEKLRSDIAGAGAAVDEKMARFRMDLAADEVSRAGRVEDLSDSFAQVRADIEERVAAFGRELSELRSAQDARLREIGVEVAAAACVRIEELSRKGAQAAALTHEETARALQSQREDFERSSRQDQLALTELRAGLAKLGRESAAEADEKISQFRVDLAAKEAARAARVEDVATGLQERLAALGRELSELRSAQRESIKEISATVEAAAAARLEEVSVRVDKSLGEGLLGVRSRLDGIDAELEKAARTHTLLAETTARVEQVRNEAEWKRLESLKRLEDFQTEVRAVILGRLLRLEAALGVRVRGRDA